LTLDKKSNLDWNKPPSEAERQLILRSLEKIPELLIRLEKYQGDLEKIRKVDLDMIKLIESMNRRLKLIELHLNLKSPGVDYDSI